MPKTQKAEIAKVVIQYEKEPLLEDLNFPGLVKIFRRYQLKEARSNAASARWKDRKDRIGLDIQAVVGEVKADTVEMESQRSIWRTTVVKGQPSTKTNEDRLKDNLMKLGKLDAKVIETIFAASQDPVAAPKSYVKLTLLEQK